MWIWQSPSLLVAGALLLAAGPALAAGGHFDVDDAAVLDPGRCQYEAWGLRVPAASASVFHLGSACSAGPLELGLNFERAQLPGARRDSAGPQLKWVAGPMLDSLSAGLALSLSFDLGDGGRPSRTLHLPLTWRAARQLWLHANVGADWAPSGGRTRRIGLSGEWAVSERLSLIAERIEFYGDWTARIGARFHLNDSISVDLSAARSGPQATRVYVIGLNHEFAR